MPSSTAGRTLAVRLVSLRPHHGRHGAGLGGGRFRLEADGRGLAARQRGVGDGRGGCDGQGCGKHEGEHGDSFREKGAFRDPESSLDGVLVADEVRTRCSERAAQDVLREGWALAPRLSAQLVGWIRREQGGAG